MPTPSHVFADIARRHGIDPADEDAIDIFFAETVPRLNLAEQKEILVELLERDGEPFVAEAAHESNMAKTPNDIAVHRRPRVESFSLAAASGTQLLFGELQPGRYTVKIDTDEHKAEIEIQPQQSTLRVRFLNGDRLYRVQAPNESLQRGRWVVLNAEPDISLDELLASELFFADSDSASDDNPR